MNEKIWVKKSVFFNSYVCLHRVEDDKDIITGNTNLAISQKSECNIPTSQKILQIGENSPVVIITIQEYILFETFINLILKWALKPPYIFLSVIIQTRIITKNKIVKLSRYNKVKIEKRHLPLD
jgi:hypothetical protein